MTVRSEKGFSLIETIVALGVLTVGVLGMAGVLVAGMNRISSAPSDVLVTQKAAQAVEAVFAARDSHKLTWNQIRNAPSGVFVSGPTSLTTPGADGLVNTIDDGPVESTDYGDQVVTLSQYKREILIEDVANTDGQLRRITVTMSYTSEGGTRTYVLRTFISSYA